MGPVWTTVGLLGRVETDDDDPDDPPLVCGKLPPEYEPFPGVEAIQTDPGLYHAIPDQMYA
jgi:hypothetical protein